MSEQRGDRTDRGDQGGEVSAAWEALVATARRTVADGLVVGTSGNVSVRIGGTGGTGDIVLVTPRASPTTGSPRTT